MKVSLPFASGLGVYTTWAPAGPIVTVPWLAGETAITVSRLAGRSPSVSLASTSRMLLELSSITVRRVSSTAVGGWLTSFTVTVMLSQSLSVPSLTQTSKVCVPGPWSSAGVQVKAPEFESIAAPAGTNPAVPLARL